MECKTLKRQHVGASSRHKSSGLPQTGGKPFRAQGRPALQVQLRGGGMMFVVVWRGRESEAEIAFIADHAPKWGYEKDSVKDVLQESFSSGFVVSATPAAWTNGGLIKVKHGSSSRCELGGQYCTPNSELAKNLRHV